MQEKTFSTFLRTAEVRKRFSESPNMHSRMLGGDPTPIPHLPMTLHVNTWPTRSRSLAGLHIAHFRRQRLCAALLLMHSMPTHTLLATLGFERSGGCFFKYAGG